VVVVVVVLSSSQALPHLRSEAVLYQRVAGGDLTPGAWATLKAAAAAVRVARSG